MAETQTNDTLPVISSRHVYNYVHTVLNSSHSIYMQVLETLQAKESGQSGLPDAASIISEKNYVMVWDVVI